MVMDTGRCKVDDTVDSRYEAGSNGGTGGLQIAQMNDDNIKFMTSQDTAIINSKEYPKTYKTKYGVKGEDVERRRGELSWRAIAFSHGNWGRANRKKGVNC